MLSLPNCDFCKHKVKDDSQDCCLAYPEGIPLEAMIRAEEGVECANGYSFEEVPGEVGTPPDDGLFKRMLR